MKPTLTVITCGPSSAKCRCRCIEGKGCEHVWDGETDRDYYENGNIRSESATCSRCGMTAMHHDLMRGDGT